MNWEGTIIYGDKSTFTSRNGNWEEAPGRDVQIIVYPDEKMGVATASLMDYYILRNGVPVGVDLFGLYDYLLETGLVKFGRHITRAEFAGLRAMVQERFKEKRNWYPDETIEPSS